MMLPNYSFTAPKSTGRDNMLSLWPLTFDEAECILKSIIEDGLNEMLSIISNKMLP